MGVRVSSKYGTWASLYTDNPADLAFDFRLAISAPGAGPCPGRGSELPSEQPSLPIPHLSFSLRLSWAPLLGLRGYFSTPIFEISIFSILSDFQGCVLLRIHVSLGADDFGRGPLCLRVS